MLQFVSVLILPLVIVLIVGNGLLRRAPVFDCFTAGAKEGAVTAFKILPALVGLLVAISMLRASGIFDALGTVLSPLLDRVGFPQELVPLALMRPVSGSGALALVRDILSHCGPDSFAGRCASVMMGSTETTFYTLAVYMGSVGISKTRYTVKAALLADLTGIVVSVLAVRLLLY